MTKLTEEIRKKGLYCKHCEEPMMTTAIDEHEAREILELLKGAFIDAVNTVSLPNMKIRAELIRAIRDVE